MAEGDGKGKVAIDPMLDFFAGSVAGMAALTVGHPFDTVKVRLQDPSTATKYRSVFHAFTTIVREERFFGLYKGITSPLASCALLNGLVFATYRSLMKLQIQHEGQVPTLMQINLAGAGCGLLSSIITTPIELIKIRQQQSLVPVPGRTASAMAPRMPSALSLAASIYRQNGLAGLYRGITATGLRDIGFGAYFAGYEAALRVLAPAPADLSADPLLDDLSTSLQLSYPRLLLAGGVAGIAGWVFTFPFDVIKTRVQSTPRTPDNPYRSTWSTAVHSYRAEGARVFVRGLAPTLLRAIPVNMVTFAAFEGVVHALS